MDQIKIAIDPGKSGGIVFRRFDGSVVTFKMPEPLRGLYASLEAIKKEDPNCICYLEKVGKHRLGNSAQSSATFAKHVGHLEMALAASSIETVEVLPTKWMNQIAPDRPKGATSQLVKARKDYIKAMMQEKYPDIRVTNYIADALGILEYALVQ